MVEKILIESGDSSKPNNYDKIVNILDNFNQYCNFEHQPVIDVSNQIRLFGEKSPEKDSIGIIPKNAITKIWEYIPFHEIQRKLFITESGFLVATYNLYQIINHPYLSSYDNFKYSFSLEDYRKDIPLIWLELLCVKDTSRGSGEAQVLIDEFIKDIKEEYFEKKKNDLVIIGIDIAGTDRGWENKSLTKYYKKLGFTIKPSSDFNIISPGSQIGIMEIYNTNLDELIFPSVPTHIPVL